MTGVRKDVEAQVLRRTIRLGSMLAIAERRDAEAAIERILTALAEAEKRAEAAEALLRDCEQVSIARGDKYLCDAIDNEGEPYQSAYLAAHLSKEASRT